LIDPFPQLHWNTDLVIKYTYSVQYIAHGKRIEHSFLKRQLSIAPRQKYWTVLSTQ